MSHPSTTCTTPAAFSKASVVRHEDEEEHEEEKKEDNKATTTTTTTQSLLTPHGIQYLMTQDDAGDLLSSPTTKKRMPLPVVVQLDQLEIFPGQQRAPPPPQQQQENHATTTTTTTLTTTCSFTLWSVTITDGSHQSCRGLIFLPLKEKNDYGPMVISVQECLAMDHDLSSPPQQQDPTPLICITRFQDIMAHHASERLEEHHSQQELPPVVVIGNNKRQQRCVGMIVPFLTQQLKAATTQRRRRKRRGPSTTTQQLHNANPKELLERSNDYYYFVTLLFGAFEGAMTTNNLPTITTEATETSTTTTTTTSTPTTTTTTATPQQLDDNENSKNDHDDHYSPWWYKLSSLSSSSSSSFKERQQQQQQHVHVQALYHLYCTHGAMQTLQSTTNHNTKSNGNACPAPSRLTKQALDHYQASVDELEQHAIFIPSRPSTTTTTSTIHSQMEHLDDQQERRSKQLQRHRQTLNDIINIVSSSSSISGSHQQFLSIDMLVKWNDMILLGRRRDGEQSPAQTSVTSTATASTASTTTTTLDMALDTNDENDNQDNRNSMTHKKEEGEDQSIIPMAASSDCASDHNITDLQQQQQLEQFLSALETLEESLVLPLTTTREDDSIMMFLLGRLTFAAVAMFGILDLAPFSSLIIPPNNGDNCGDNDDGDNDINQCLAWIVFNWALRRGGWPFSIPSFFGDLEEENCVSSSSSTTKESNGDHNDATIADRKPVPFVTAMVQTRQHISLATRGEPLKDDDVPSAPVSYIGVFAPLVSLLLDRLVLSMNQFTELAKQKGQWALEETEDRLLRQAREKAARGICIICLDDNPNIATLCCGKAVHMNCIAEWLTSHSSCPQCRHDIPSIRTTKMFPNNPTTAARGHQLHPPQHQLASRFQRTLDDLDDDSMTYRELLNFISNSTDDDDDDDDSGDDSASSSSSSSSSTSSSESSSESPSTTDTSTSPSRGLISHRTLTSAGSTVANDGHHHYHHHYRNGNHDDATATNSNRGHDSDVQHEGQDDNSDDDVTIDGHAVHVVFDYEEMLHDSSSRRVVTRGTSGIFRNDLFVDDDDDDDDDDNHHSYNAVHSQFSAPMDWDGDEEDNDQNTNESSTDDDGAGSDILSSLRRLRRMERHGYQGGLVSSSSSSSSESCDDDVAHNRHTLAGARGRRRHQLLAATAAAALSRSSSSNNNNAPPVGLIDPGSFPRLSFLDPSLLNDVRRPRENEEEEEFGTAFFADSSSSHHSSSSLHDESSAGRAPLLGETGVEHEHGRPQSFTTSSSHRADPLATPLLHRLVTPSSDQGDSERSSSSSPNDSDHTVATAANEQSDNASNAEEAEDDNESMLPFRYSRFGDTPGTICLEENCWNRAAKACCNSRCGQCCLQHGSLACARHGRAPLVGETGVDQEHGRPQSSTTIAHPIYPPW